MAAVNTFAGATLDRAADRRTDAAWLAAALADPGSRAVVATAAGVLLAGEEPALVPAGAAARLDGAGDPVLLGLRDGVATFAVDVDGCGDEQVAALSPGSAIVGLREAAPLVSQADGGLLAYAAAELNWQRRHRYCSNCGAPTASAEGGHQRACPACGAQHHPRTDPVVIMLVVDGDRALLGRQRVWPPGRYSALAGFVEPGESLEEAVAREVREETGCDVADVAYRSSQPWPFPSSLMLGFRARWVAGTPATLDGELEDVRWVSAEQARGAAAGEGPLGLPPPLAIARRLIDEWLGET